MELKIASIKENALLKRREVRFIIEHGTIGNTPGRLEVRKAIASEIKAEPEAVFVQEIETKTGTSTALGSANIYETTEQANLIEPKHIIQRNNPKPKEEVKA